MSSTTCRRRSRSTPSKRIYFFSGCLRCGQCRRNLAGQVNNGKKHYRCKLTVDYELPADVDHPANIYVSEDRLAVGVDAWIKTTLTKEHRDELVCQMFMAAQGLGEDEAVEAARAQLTEACARLDNLRPLAERGQDLASVVGWIKEAEGARATAQARLSAMKARVAPTRAEIEKMIDRAIDLVTPLDGCTDAARGALYESMGLRMVLRADQRHLSVSADLTHVWGNRVCPRGDLNPHALSGTSTSS